jgi:hypothetical protein
MLASVTSVVDTVQMIPKPMTDNVVPRADEVSDNVQCYTEFEPHRNRDRTLRTLVHSGFDAGNTDIEKGWVTRILEEFVQPTIITEAQKQGYRDFKHMLYGNKLSGPLSLHISVIRVGFIYLCDPPGVWGALPENFEHLWESDVELYMTPLIDDVTIENFKFVRSPKYAVPYRHMLIDETCTRITASFPIGSYVLTLLPTKENKNIMLSTILIP